MSLYYKQFTNKFIKSRTKMTKVALITGGARGIGRGIALQLAKDGFNIAITDLASAKEAGEFTVQELQYLEIKAVFIVADSTKKEEMVHAVEEATNVLGGFDVIVNNAGICVPASILESSADLYRKTFDVNVSGVLYGIQAAAAKFLELNKKGKIINACSAAGEEALPLMGVYSSSKFAVKGLTQAASKELGPKGITVNAYCPGLIATDMAIEMEQKTQKLTGAGAGETTNAIVSGTSLGRIGTTQDIAGLVSFLASDKSDYITGQSIVVDGGMVYP